MYSYTSVILYMVLTALSFTFIDKLGDYVNPIFSLFCMTICATIWFNLINYKNLKNMYVKCINHKTLYLLLAITIGINWMCAIFAPNKSDPFVYIAACFMSSAICGLVLNKNSQHKHF